MVNPKRQHHSPPLARVMGVGRQQHTPWLNVDNEIKEALDIQNKKLNIIIKNIPEDNNTCDNVLIQEIAAQLNIQPDISDCTRIGKDGENVPKPLRFKVGTLNNIVCNNFCMLLLYYIFNKLGANMFSLFIDINHVNRANKYLYQIITCICTIFHIECFLDCLSLHNLYHACIVCVIYGCFTFRHFDMFIFMLDNDIMLAVYVTNIECLKNKGISCYKFSII